MTAKECPTDLLAKDRHAGLSPAEKRLLEEHLLRCKGCRTWQKLGRDFDIEAEVAAGDAELLTRISRRLPQRAQLARVPASASSPRVLGASFVTIRRTKRRRRALYVGFGLGLLATAAAAAVLGLRLKPQPPEVDPQWFRSAAAAEPREATGSLRATSPQDEPDVNAKDRSREEEPTPPSGKSGLARSASSEPAVAHERPTPSITPLELYRKANLARRAKQSGQAIALFTELQSRYPQSNEARLALVPFGNTLLEHGKAGAALTRFERYLRSGDSALAAEALYGRARALSVVGTKGDQSRGWQRLLDQYPNSPYASTAQRKLEALR